MDREVATVIELQQLPARAILEDGCGDLWVESAGIFVRLRDNLERTANDLVECFAPLTLVHPLECDPDPILVEDLSTLRPGDVIEVRMGDTTTRGPVGKVHTVSGGEATRVDWIATPDGQTLWSDGQSLWSDLINRRSEVYLVSTAKHALPTEPGSVLTRAVIRGEETMGPIVLGDDGWWSSPRKVDGHRIHVEEHITDWTVGKVVKADEENG